MKNLGSGLALQLILSRNVSMIIYQRMTSSIMLKIWATLAHLYCFLLLLHDACGVFKACLISAIERGEKDAFLNILINKDQIIRKSYSRCIR